MKRKLVFAASFMLLMGCAEKALVCGVSGEITGLTGENQVYVLKPVSEFERDTLLSAPISNGKFTFDIPAEDLGLIYELSFEGERGRISFFAENGNVVVSGAKDNMFFSEVTGTYENDRMKLQRDFIRKMADARDSEFAGSNDREAAREELKKYDQMMNNFRDSLIKSNPKSIYGLYLVKQSLPMMKHQEIDEKLTFFAEELKQHPYYQEMAARANVLRKIAPGAIAPDFTAQTPAGDSLRLSSLRGHYVLLDFWASWCVPCRAETVHTKKLYEEFSDKGLIILSFSLDSDPAKWKEAIETDGMVWSNASDLVGGKISPIATLYGIDGIPAIWLIDPDGKIVAEGVRGEKLYELCKEIFNK